MKEHHIRTGIMLAAFIVGAFIAWGITITSMHSNAIKQECAHYNPRTGEFKWGPLQ